MNRKGKSLDFVLLVPCALELGQHWGSCFSLSSCWCCCVSFHGKARQRQRLQCYRSGHPTSQPYAHANEDAVHSAERKPFLSWPGDFPSVLICILGFCGCVVAVILLTRENNLCVTVAKSDEVGKVEPSNWSFPRFCGVTLGVSGLLSHRRHLGSA